MTTHRKTVQSSEGETTTRAPEESQIGRQRRTALSALFGVAALAGIVTVSASCAEAATESDADPDAETDSGAPSTIDSGEAIDAGPGDAGCEADSDTCTTEMLPCDDVDWCPSETNLDGRLALASVWGSGPKDVWAVGTAGTVIHWNGSEWSSTPASTTQSLYAVWGSGPNDVWIVSSPHVIFRGGGFVNGTASWSPVTPVADYATVSGSRGKLIQTIWGTSASDVWIGGMSFVNKSGQPQESRWRSVTVDGGAGWTPVSNCPKTGTCPSVTAMWGSGPEDIWAVGPAGVTLHTHGIDAGDGGVPDWTAFDSQSTAALQAVWGSGPGDVWTVGTKGAIRHWAAGAARWSIVESPTTEDLNSLWGSGPEDIWAVGDHGTLLHYDGTSWEKATAAFPLGEKPHLRGVWGSGPNDVWAVGDGIVLHFSGFKTSARGAGK